MIRIICGAAATSSYRNLSNKLDVLPISYLFINGVCNR